jgi:hypothetical protein
VRVVFVIIVCLCGSALAPHRATADVVVVKYDFADNLGDQASQPPVTVVSGIQNISSLSITRGAGVTAQAAGTSSLASVGWTETSSEAAITANDYYTFTVTPTSGSALTLTSIDFGTFTSGNSLNRPKNFFVRSSASGSTDLLSWSVLDNLLTDRFVPLSDFGTTFQDLTSAVTFQLYGWNGGSGRWALANSSAEGGIVIKGTVSAVPEPAAVRLGFLVCSILAFGCGAKALLTMFVCRGKA